MDSGDERNSAIGEAMKNGTMAATYILGMTVGLMGVLVGWLLADGNKSGD
jgi:hypothetical protein